MRSDLRCRILFALTLLLLVTTPVMAQGSLGVREVTDVEHAGHCHLAGDCDAVSFMTPTAPATEDWLAHAGSFQSSFPVYQDQLLPGSGIKLVPNPPPIA